MSHRARKRPLSQPLVILLAAVAVVAVIGYLATRGAKSGASVDARPGVPATQPVASAGQAGKPDPAVQPAPPEPLLVTQTPTGAPTGPAAPGAGSTASAAGAVKPSTRPSWDALMATAPTSPAKPSHAPSREPGSVPPLPADADVPATVREAAAQAATGNLTGALGMYSAALTSGRLSETEARQVRVAADAVGRQAILTPKRLGDWAFGTTYAVQPGDSLERIARNHAISWELLGRMNDISDPRKLRAGRVIKTIKGPFSAIVDKSDFELQVWLCDSPETDPGAPGSLFVMRFPVGLGKNDSTPTGAWRVTPGGKLKNPKFWGAGDLPPMEADDPQNPLGEFWIALTGVSGAAEGRESYGIHGTIEPESIGKQSSLGCIRLRAEDIALVYELLVDGKSRVIVRD